MEFTLDELRKIHDALTPELIRYLELTNGTGMVMPIKGDMLIQQSEAAKVLDVNTTSISRFVREGILTPYYTPFSTRRKFWLSEVKALAKKGLQKAP